MPHASAVFALPAQLSFRECHFDKDAALFPPPRRRRRPGPFLYDQCYGLEPLLAPFLLPPADRVKDFLAVYAILLSPQSSLLSPEFARFSRFPGNTPP